MAFWGEKNMSAFRLSRSVMLFVGLCLAAVVVGACTAISTSGDYFLQCNTQADCFAHGPDFAKTTCSTDHTCVPIATDTSLCTSHQDCTTKAGGAASICRKTDRKCVPVLNDLCTKVFADKADLLDDNAIFLGWIYPNDANGAQEELGLEMARQEIRKGFGRGLPAATPGGAPRPLVIVGCPVELSGPTVAGAAAGHLVKDLQVATVLGGQITEQSLQIANNATIPQKTLQLTYGFTSAITNLADNDLVFRVEFNDAVSLKAVINPFMSQVLEPKVRADGIALPGEDIRVALIVNPSLSNSLPAQIVQTTLIFNGKSVADNGANFLRVSGGDANDPIDYPDPARKTAQAVAQILPFKPHVVFISGPPLYIGQSMIPIDSQWPMGTPKPLFFSVVASWQLPVIAGIGANGSLRQRYFGHLMVAPAPNPDAKTGWIVGLRSLFPELTNAAIGSITAYVYDSVYLAAYAILATGSDQIDGPALSKALRRITATGGDAITFGADQVSVAKGALASGKPLTYQGVDGPIVFDAAGDRSTSGSVFCVSSNAGNVASGLHQSGFVVDATTGAVISSTNTCPTAPGVP